MKMKLHTQEEADVNITSLIDCMMMVIIFFMVIMSAQYIFGVAIKFPAGQQQSKQPPKTQENKSIVVYITADRITTDHILVHDGIVKLNGEEIPLVVSDSTNMEEWPKEREKAWNYLKGQLQDLIKKGYKTDVLMIQGDMKTYHGKAMKVIDIGKDVGIQGFSLAPPTQ